MFEFIKPITEQIEPIVAAAQCSLVDVQFINEGHGWILRIYIEKNSGTTGMAECTVVSKHLSALLDTDDSIPYSYHLEVSTPGTHRPLRKKEDFIRFTGERAAIKMLTTWPDNNGIARKRFKGVLSGVDEENILIRIVSQNIDLLDSVQEVVIRIPITQISKANLDPVFNV